MANDRNRTEGPDQPARGDRGDMNPESIRSGADDEVRGIADDEDDEFEDVEDLEDEDDSDGSI